MISYKNKEHIIQMISLLKTFFFLSAIIVASNIIQLLYNQSFSFDLLLQVGLFLVLVELALKIKRSSSNQIINKPVLSEDCSYYLTKIGLSSIFLSFTLPSLII